MTALTLRASTLTRKWRLLLFGWGLGLTWTLVVAAPYASRHLSLEFAMAGYAVVWLFGLGAIAFGCRWMGAQFAKRERATARILYLANHDGLTQLPNRHLFFDRLKGALAQSAREGRRAALLLIDLDEFKVVNDVFGHETGDRVLREVARRLVAAVREKDIVARVGGDEFAVLLNDLQDAHVVARVANEILESIGAPIRLPGDALTIGASMGIAFFPDDAAGPEDMVRAADTAMREVKDLERTGFNFAGASGVATIRRPLREKRRISLCG